MESSNNIDIKLSELCVRKTTYLCCKCNLKFNDLLEQLNHIKTVHCSYVFKCSFCVKNLHIFDNIESLEQHFSKFHGTEKKTFYMCKLCNYSSELYHDFIGHANNQHSSRYLCQQYHNNIAYYYNSHEIQSYTHSNQSPKKQVLDFCKSIYKIHSICDFYYCFVNMKKFISEESCDLKCNFCNIKFENWALFTCHLEDEFHINAKKEYRCIECKKIFSTEVKIQEHVRGHIVSNFKKTCYLCKTFYNTPLQLEYHLLSKHEVPNGDFKCTLCDKYFEDVEQFYVHKLEQPINEKIFNCKLCQTNFSFEQQLLNHSTMHCLIDNKEKSNDQSPVKLI